MLPGNGKSFSLKTSCKNRIFSVVGVYYHEDIIDELIIRGYFLDNALTVEGGKMKIVWGKGDKLHVLDNFNADDYTDFIVPDYIDRRISTPMFRVVYSQASASALSLEGVFTP